MNEQGAAREPGLYEAYHSRAIDLARGARFAMDQAMRGGDDLHKEFEIAVDPIGQQMRVGVTMPMDRHSRPGISCGEMAGFPSQPGVVEVHFTSVPEGSFCILSLARARGRIRRPVRSDTFRDRPGSMFDRLELRLHVPAVLPEYSVQDRRRSRRLYSEPDRPQNRLVGVRVGHDERDITDQGREPSIYQIGDVLVFGLQHRIGKMRYATMKQLVENKRTTEASIRQ